MRPALKKRRWPTAVPQTTRHSDRPLFAQTKHNRGVTRFLRRGRSAVRTEWRLLMTTHNLESSTVTTYDRAGLNGLHGCRERQSNPARPHSNQPTPPPARPGPRAQRSCDSLVALRSSATAPADRSYVADSGTFAALDPNAIPVRRPARRDRMREHLLLCSLLWCHKASSALGLRSAPFAVDPSEQTLKGPTNGEDVPNRQRYQCQQVTRLVEARIDGDQNETPRDRIQTS